MHNSVCGTARKFGVHSCLLTPGLSKYAFCLQVIGIVNNAKTTLPVIRKFPNFPAMKNIEYFLVRGLFFVFSHISLRWGKRLALGLTFLTEHIIRYRRKVILDNLRKVYGDQLPKPQKQFIHEIYKHFIFLWMEFLQSPHINSETVNRLLHIKNPEVLEMIRRRESGIIFISGHFGNFEWLGQGLTLMNLPPILGIAKKQSNLKVDAFIVKLRQQNGMRIIYTKEAMRESEKALRNKEIVAIAFDQDARHKGVFVDFMGLPSSTAVGTAVLHLRTGAKIVLVISVRKDYAQFDVYLKEIKIPELSGTLDDKIKAITQICTSEFEKWVRRYPEQWFWVHKRWKTQPPAEQSI